MTCNTALKFLLEEVPRMVLLICNLVNVFTCEVWHAEQVLRLLTTDQEFDCHGWHQTFGFLMQVGSL